ncbi:MAG: tetratricopeptide repeat protein [Pseudomonadota bacterium]
MVRRSNKPGRAMKQLQQSDVQNLGALLNAGKHREVEAKARKLARKFSDAPVLYDLLSKAQLAQSDFKGAAKTLEVLEKLKPDYIDGSYNLAMAYMNLGRTEEAVAKFRSVVEKKPDDADAFNNLGAALFELERFEEAIEAYETAVKLKPNYVPALRNLGAALRDMRRFEESEKYLSKIPFLKPRFAPGHLSLGVTYRQLGKLEKALKCFETALKLDPKNREANYELGNIYAQNSRFDDAIEAYEKVNTAETRVKVLEVLHKQGANRDSLLAKLSALNAAEPKNLRAAAFSAFASHQYQIEDTHTFAPDPLQYVSIRTIDAHLEKEEGFLEELISAAETVTAVWENRTTRGGFQTHGNLFEQGEVFEKLERLIREQLEAYRSEADARDAGIIKDFPKRFDLNGWHVKLMKSGYQKPHIHTRGWVSGVLYLKIPKEIKGNEGSIAFSLHGYDYRKENDAIPIKEHRPREGELVLFPSSLFHHTVPFDSSEDRQCIAFDVLPVA